MGQPRITIDTATHSGFQPVDATRQRQYDELAKAGTLEEIVKTEIGQEAMASPVFQAYLAKRRALGNSGLTQA